MLLWSSVDAKQMKNKGKEEQRERKTKGKKNKDMNEKRW